MSNDKLKVGIAGYGVVGKLRRFFIDNHPNMKTIAVCDVRFNKDGSMTDPEIVGSDYLSLESKSADSSFSGVLFNDVYLYKNHKNLIKNHSLDVLFVCLPNYLASEVTIAGLENGLHVFCEKPPGRTIEDIQRVIEVEKRNPDLKLKYGFNHRHHESVKEAKRLIDSRQYGEVINFRGVYGKSKIIPFSGGWRSRRQYAGGGILLDQGIHMLDMIRYFSGDYQEIKSFVSNNYWHHDVEDNAYAIMRDDVGRVAMLHSTATQWQHRFRLEIALQEATIELTGILSGSKSYGEEKLIIIPRSEESVNGSQHETTFSYLEDNSWRDEINEFADIILNDKIVLNGNSIDAIRVMEMVYQIYSADKSWQKGI